MRLRRLKMMALVSLLAAITTVIMKFTAYYITDSASIFSDAMESLVNIVASLVTFVSITIASMPADDNHNYGHDKVEYFSCGFEGCFILFAAASILYESFHNFFSQSRLVNIDIGIWITLGTCVVNFLAAYFIMRTAKQYHSISLEADAHHIYTDIWTSLAVAAGLFIMWYLDDPKYQFIDLLMALFVAVNIIRTGFKLIKRAVDGLMDVALPVEEQQQVENIVKSVIAIDSKIHLKSFKSRVAGHKKFIDLIILFPQQSTVKESHDICDSIEAALEQKFINSHVTIHVEPLH